MGAIHSKVSRTSDVFRANAGHMEALVQELSAQAAAVERGGPDDQRDRHAARGKMLARQRVAQVLDPGSPFLEIGQFAAWDVYDEPVPSAALVAGIGRVSGREVVVIANDPTVRGGAYHRITIKKQLRAQEIAKENALPCIYLLDSGQSVSQAQDDIFPDREHFGRILFNQARMRAAAIAQIACVMGPCSGGASFIPALADESVMVKGQGAVFVSDPALVKASTGELVNAHELGGAEVHARQSGIADHLADNDAHALAIVRRIIGNLNRTKRMQLDLRKPVAPLRPAAEIGGIVPADDHAPLDMREIIARVFDGSQFDEFAAGLGETILTGFSHLHGIPVGIVADNGELHPEAARKAADFVELCNGRSLPLIFLQNTVGPAMGRAAEHSGIVHEGARLIAALANARVPRITLVVGGAFGNGNFGMAGRAFSPRFLWIWPNARVAAMDGVRTADLLAQLKREDIERSGPSWNADEEAEFRAPILRKFEKQSRPLHSSARLWDDGIIDPAKTREVLALSLSAALNAPLV